MGSWGIEIFALRDAINAGKVRGPRVLAAGAYISATGGHGDIYGMREGVLASFQPSGICDGPAECRKAVRLQIKRGADVIKITATGGASEDNGYREAQAELFDDELREAVATAHSLGRKVGAHAHGTAGINAALRAGVDSIEHGSFLDQESIKLFKKSGAYLVPTLMLQDYFAEGIKHAKSDLGRSRRKAFLEQPDNVAKAYRAGVKIALGTDAGFFPHGENARELIWYVKIGMNEMDAIKTATVNAADLIGRSHDLGTLERGKFADLIATRENPLKDIEALTRVSFVMKEGKVYKMAEP
jgi:imidazolonepropionase-like amidohydrolase